MRRSCAQQICALLVAQGAAARVERRVGSAVVVVDLPDGRTAVWGLADRGRLRALLFSGSNLVGLLPPQHRTSSIQGRSERIATADYGRPVTITSARRT